MIKELYAKISKNDFWKTLFSNFLSAFIGESGSTVINLIVVIILIRLIGNSGYSILILAQSYMLIMDTLLNVQSWKSVIQYGKEALVSKKINEFYGYVKLGCILDIITAIIGGFLSILLSEVIGSVFNWSNELILCAKIFSLTIFSHFAGTPTALLRIQNKFNLVAVQKIMSSLIKLISFLVILLVNKNISVVNAVIVYTITDVIGNLLLVIFAVYVFRKEYSIKKLIKSKLPSKYKKFINFTLWGTLIDIVDIPITYFDVFIVSFINVELVSVYKVFKQIVSILSKFTFTMQQAILPQFSELSAKDLKENSYKIMIKIRNVSFILFGIISLVVGLSSPIWLHLFYGEIYSSNWYILLIYLLLQTIILSYATIHPYFLSLGKAKKGALYVFIANMLYMVLSLLLIKKGGLLSLIICNFIQGIIVISLKTYDIKKTLYNKEVQV